ncbi:GNAT family N-acetyltransferase [Chitinimonas viridis]|uniref:GNAT family N-acetyltransferase n=1 Tax=Chitinimonas viridis TaxID=664880 RepID=A0ABT8B5W0_9NEIS|nr:GNAT family N-acetyltransferase [Chitinimonas viridis]MDN3577506.1 GNAT family N-acetyltransferase [Chitinimonas viridis]
MMDLSQSLVDATAMIFHRFEGVVRDRGDYLCITTPGNPTFYWGNYLLFAQAPGLGVLADWEALFIADIAAEQPQSRHRCFAWLGGAGEQAQFLQAGYKVYASQALACSQPSKAPGMNPQVQVRPLVSEMDWQAAIAVQVASRDESQEQQAYETFKTAQFATYRSMVAAGLGQRYGAFAGDTLVAELGIFMGEGGLARYQNVCTHPDWRRQGIAKRLVYEAGHQAIAEFGATKLVIVADEEGPIQLYRSVGFAPVGVAYGVDKAPPAAQDKEN